MSWLRIFPVNIPRLFRFSHSPVRRTYFPSSCRPRPRSRSPYPIVPPLFAVGMAGFPTQLRVCCWYASIAAPPIRKLVRAPPSSTPFTNPARLSRHALRCVSPAAAGMPIYLVLDAVVRLFFAHEVVRVQLVALHVVSEVG